MIRYYVVDRCQQIAGATLYYVVLIDWGLGCAEQILHIFIIYALFFGVLPRNRQARHSPPPRERSRKDLLP